MDASTSTLPVLRPLRLGELLDQAIRLYRRNFLSFVAIIALGYIPYAIVQIGSSALSMYSAQNLQPGNSYNLFASPAYWLSIFGSFFSLLIYVIFVTGMATAALVNAVSRNYLGHKTGVLEAYRLLGASSWKLLGTLVLFVLVGVIASIWTIIPCAGWFSGPGLLVFLSALVSPVIPSVVVIEKLAGGDAIFRAWDLTRRRFWWLLGFAIVIYLFNALVVTGPTLLISYSLASLLRSTILSSNAALIATLVSTAAGSLVHLLILPIQLTAWTLVYFDLRVRTEGFDLALASLDPSGENLDLSSVPVSPSAKRWLTGEDIGRFLAVSLAIVGLYALLVGMVMLIGVGASSLFNF